MVLLEAARGRTSARVRFGRRESERSDLVRSDSGLVGDDDEAARGGELAGVWIGDDEDAARDERTTSGTSGADQAVSAVGCDGAGSQCARCRTRSNSSFGGDGKE